MGKRSNFQRRERDFYPTPHEAVVPLLSHAPNYDSFWEPCAGDGALVGHLVSKGFTCALATDIEPRHTLVKTGDALIVSCPPYAQQIITNPPWDRKILHPMIERFSAVRPTWLLFDASWAYTKQSAPFMPFCHKIVCVGRVKWFPDTKMTGKDDCSWYFFDQSYISEGSTFYGR